MFLNPLLNDHLLNADTPALPARVLVVEDDPAIATVLQEYLEEGGCHVSIAQNGQEALSLLARESGYVVLLDVLMPLLDGYGVIAWLETAHLLTHHQIILMSAGAERAKVDALLQAGKVAAYMRKPFHLRQVLGLVTQLAAISEPMEDKTSNQRTS